MYNVHYVYGHAKNISCGRLVIKLFHCVTRHQEMKKIKIISRKEGG